MLRCFADKEVGLMTKKIQAAPDRIEIRSGGYTT